MTSVRRSWTRLFSRTACLCLAAGIHEVNGVMVSSVEAPREAIDPLRRGAPVALFIERDGKLRYLSFEME